jgi:hypothetical protein
MYSRFDPSLSFPSLGRSRNPLPLHVALLSEAGRDEPMKLLDGAGFTSLELEFERPLRNDGVLVLWLDRHDLSRLQAF